MYPDRLQPGQFLSDVYQKAGISMLTTKKSYQLLLELQSRVYQQLDLLHL
jgi:hypothetical protein